MKCGKRIVLFTLFAMNLVDQPAPEVTIEQGTLSGKISTDGSFFEYVGIPYATTNSSTRFKGPLPPPKWSGVFKAVDENSRCTQSMSRVVVGSQDCLKINVYVPAKAKIPLPVMVYIHGGAFIGGDGGKMILGPDFLVKHDVIMVSFKYRLGALGFLCLGIKEALGNAGLKDQDLEFKSKQEEKEVALKLKNHYFGDKDISEENIANVTDLLGHVYFEMPSILEAELMTQTSNASVYSFYFAYSGNRNFVKYMTRYANEVGACHGDDLLYIFKGFIIPYRISKEDQTIIDWMTTMLTNFAKYGNPTPNDLPVKWVPHGKDQLNFLKIDNELKMIPVPNPEDYQL